MKKLITGSILACLCTLAQAEVTVEDAKVRAVPPTQKISAAFMNIVNTGPESVAIVSAQSPASETVELHTHTRDGDKMMMRQIDQIDLPAGETVMLKPGGLHLMLIGLNQAIAVDDQVSFTLTLSNGETLTVEAPVTEVMPGMHAGHQGKMHGDHSKMHGQGKDSSMGKDDHGHHGMKHGHNHN